MNKIKYIFASALAALAMTGCSGFLDQNPDNIYTNDQIYGDKNMIKSVLANLYGRITYGQHLDDTWQFTLIDEAAKSESGPDHYSTYENNRWRVYDYVMIRNCNQFLEGLRNTHVMSDVEKAPLEGEVRFIRAWVYFNMCRSLGGVSLMGDSVYGYTGPDDINSLLKARSTEAQTYDYIIKECKEAAKMLGADKTVHSARANKWAAKMLQARAAIYAASLAKYNNQMTNPIKTAGGEVGIPADKANGYYHEALAAAKDVIENSPYKLQDNYPNDKGKNFYEAVTSKENNSEVIWARDYYYPGSTHGFTQSNIPASHAEDIDNSYAGPTLNLVEMFEPLNTPTPGQAQKIETKLADGSYKFYDKATDPFSNRDPRLYGSVIYPGAPFKGSEVILQAGQLRMNNGKWELKTGKLDSKDEQGNLLTSQNGPMQSNDQHINKTGFYFRKFLDETPGASTRGRRADTWWPYFRIAEAYMIACEASFELGNSSDALSYINKVRQRAGVQDLHSLNFNQIVHENAVEFAFEFHRWWDLKRWRLADKIFNGNPNDEHARHRRLWPYRVVAPGNSNNGKWVFVEDFFFMSPNARYFKVQNYYNFYDNSWLNRNPLLVKNPYQ